MESRSVRPLALCALNEAVSGVLDEAVWGALDGAVQGALDEALWGIWDEAECKASSESEPQECLGRRTPSFLFSHEHGNPRGQFIYIVLDCNQVKGG